MPMTTKDVSTYEIKINNTLSKIIAWFKVNNLQVNITKFAHT